MLAKLRLDQTKTYEQCIAAKAIAKMIVAFVEGREHFLSVGSEQGIIKGWEDIVIEESDSSYTHIQIKRQQAPFSGITATCDQALTVNRSDQGPSTLDKAMAELAKWSKNKTSTIKRRFILELPEPSIEIKKDFAVRNFNDFLLLVRPITTVKGLKELQNTAKDANAIKVFKWLTTWCGFEDWAHILDILSNFETVTPGNETVIDDNSIEILAPVFHECDEVLRKIKSYTLDNSTYTGAIAPRQLLFQLESHLLPTIRTWTQFDHNGSTFQVSGIHDLETNTEIERPSKMVPLLLKNDRVRSLKINDHRTANNLKTPISEIFQLAIHLNGNCTALCLNWLGWKEAIKNKAGNTLGISKNDFDTLSISENPNISPIAEAKTLNLNDQDILGIDLKNELVKATWQLVDYRIIELIGLMHIGNCSDLRNGVEDRWVDWKQTLAIDLEAQKQLFKTLLYPNAEGLGINEQLRLGPKTVYIMADAIHLLLIISVALSDENGDWTKIENNLSVNAIGLNCWSGLPDQKSNVWEIDDEDCVNGLIGRESCDILIISQSKLPVSDIYNLPLDSGNKPVNSLATRHRPQLLITLNRIIKKHIKKGEINPFREYLKKLISNNKESINESINSVPI